MYTKFIVCLICKTKSYVKDKYLLQMNLVLLTFYINSLTDIKKVNSYIYFIRTKVGFF